MTDEKNKGLGLGQIAAAILIPVIASGTSPWWWEKVFGSNNQPAQVAQQPTLPEVSAPPALSPSPLPTISANIALAPSPLVSGNEPKSPLQNALTPNTATAPVDIKWSDSLYSLDINTSKGLKFAFTCPAFEQQSDQMRGNSLWGTNPYTAQASICLAGVHSGVINKERGGVVNIEVRGGQQSFIGSQRFGVLSKGYSSQDYSFVVMGANVQGNKAKN
jgi:hypothetical protein